MNIVDEFETISAIATPLGTGGVGVVRVSGDKAFEVVQKIFSKEIKEHGKICHGWIVEDNTKIDEVILLPFKAPNSYTGEDIIENKHGLWKYTVISFRMIYVSQKEITPVCFKP